MKICVALIAHDVHLRQDFAKLKAAAVPHTSLQRGPFRERNVGIHTIGISASLPKDQALRQLRNEALDAEGLLILVEENAQQLTVGISNAALILAFPVAAVGPSLKNFCHSKIASLVRRLGVILASNEEKLMRLPLENFCAEEMQLLAARCRETNAPGNFQEDFEALLKQLRRRVRPRQKTSYKGVYAVDDEEKFFEYGLERHARFGTSRPHTVECEIQGHFRFGRKTDHTRHYNVSKGEGDRTWISGDFPSCHGKIENVPGKTHLNMFCNDYFE